MEGGQEKEQMMSRIKEFNIFCAKYGCPDLFIVFTLWYGWTEQKQQAEKWKAEAEKLALKLEKYEKTKNEQRPHKSATAPEEE